MSDFKPRVFRRNNKNLIIIWEAKELSKDQKESIKVDIEDEEDESISDISFSQFIPENKEKFKDDTQGIIVDQGANNIDPEKQYTVRVVLGSQSQISRTIQAFPCRLSKKSNKCFLYAWDRNRGQWSKCEGIEDPKTKEFRILVDYPDKK